MKVALALLGMLGWAICAGYEIGASADWWAGTPWPHWWLAGCFVFLAVDCLFDAARHATGRRP